MLPLPGHKSVPIDTEEYRRQVDEAFRHAGREWDAVYGISSDLYSITETAARFARQRDYTNAAAIYEVVAVRTLSRYLSYAEWLKNHYLAKNNLAAALEMAELIFRKRPWLRKRYSRLSTLKEELTAADL